MVIVSDAWQRQAWAFRWPCTPRPTTIGEVGIWLWRGGGLSEEPAKIAPPYALEMAGDWRAAAVAWEQLGCPYEQALALAGGDESAQRDALSIFER